MLNILRLILDTVFPFHDCLRRLQTVTVEDFRRYLTVQAHANTTVLSDYNLPVIRAAITANKFHDHKPASALLATLISDWYKQLPNKPTIFVPIPLSKSREKERGYNQVTRILASVPEPINIAPLLIRTKHTAPQTSLPREKRLKNVLDAFSYVPHPDLISCERIVLVDDVITTGSTLKAARKTLIAHLPKRCEVICLALAH
ncbi:MAG TPA: phosphoribosyltransferase family protein [Candidatus Paceibacterota bacterium]|nr:phosphoribosyltransferase family protein [Candidatus Paceibacterota bacterium]